METVTLVLTMLLAVVMSGFVVRISPRPVPLPLVQILLGALVAAFTNFQVELEPEIFFMLFLPPLLFLDGWRIPKEGLFRDMGTILELALGLVLFTVIGMGFFLNWLIPSMPLAVAFALAAIISPTDPVAVSAISKRVAIPKRIMHVLEGESLLNDATGLVCFAIAVAAVKTGGFSVSDASLRFFQLASGGIAVGFLFTLVVTRAKNWIAKRFGEETGTQILISLLIPFGAYLIAEHFHVSGILAAVAAGITMSYAEITGQAEAITRVRRNAVWDTVQFAANGIIFTLLGMQLPDIIDGAARVVRETGHVEPWWLALYVLATTLGLAVLRFIWVWASIHFMMFRAARKRDEVKKPNWRLIAVISVAGVRGAVTLAGVLTLPLLVSKGVPFPARELAIFLAAGVIVVSLVLASFLLPRLMKGLALPPEPSHESEEDMARSIAAEAAIKAIEKVQHDLAEGRSDADVYADAAARIMDVYRRRLERVGKHGEEKDMIRKVDEIERQLRLAGLRAERDEIFHLARTRKIQDDLMRKLVREIDLLDARYAL